MTERQSYSPDEIAARHGISRATVWRLMKGGELGYRKTIRGRRITLEDEKRFLEGPTHAPSAGPGFIYFVECGDFIKIGFTKSVPKRMRGLRNTIPQEIILLHFMPGTLAREAQLLLQFASLRHRSEWFRKDAKLVTFIQTLKRRGDRV